MKLSRKIINCLLQLQTAANELNEAWLHEKIKRWLNRRYLVHPINQRRLTHGYFATLFRELKTHPDKFMSYMRMDLESFNYLLSIVEPYLKPRRKRQNFISAEERLVLTLR